MVLSKTATRCIVGLLLAAIVANSAGLAQGPIRRWIQTRRATAAPVVKQSQPIISSGQDCPGGVCALPGSIPTYQPTYQPSYSPAMIVSTPPVITATPVAMPAPVPNPPAAPPAQTTARKPMEKPTEAREKFRRALVAAARRAASKGSISRREALRIRVASLSPAFLEAAEELCVVQMVFSGEDADAIPYNEDGTVDKTAINWEGLTAFLEAILPLLLELLLALGLGA